MTADSGRQRTDWLRQQLDDDERIARAAFNSGNGDWGRCDHEDVDEAHLLDCPIVSGRGIYLYNEGGHDADQAEHIVRHNPARVLADVAAKRNIVGLCAGALDDPDAGWLADYVLRHLTAAYADRPGYRDEWPTSEGGQR